MHHLTPECVGPALAADVMRARSASLDGVCVDDAVESRAAARAWADLEASRERPPSWRRERKLKDEVLTSNQPIISTMLGHHGGVEVGGGEEEKDARCEKARVGTLDMGEARTGVDSGGLEGKDRRVGAVEATSALNIAIGV